MSEASDTPKSIDLDSMSLDQLQQVKQQEEQRLEALSSRYAQLRAAAARLNAASAAVSEMSPALQGKQVMVPMTASLYVPAQLVQPDKLLVDLGTGFFAERSSKETAAFLQRKLKLVDANSDNVTKAVQMTNRNLESVTVAMQGKMLEIRARQEGAKHQAMVQGKE